jgi:N-acetyl-gamma-glutamyl-phosphate reductase
MLKVAILGGSGYTGCELLRLLQNHPHAKIAAVTSERSSGLPVSDVFLSFRNSDLAFESLSLKSLKKRADLFFMCLPHKTSQEAAASLVSAGRKVIDLSADYRLRSAIEYKKWYKTPHRFKHLLKKAVYGLPEIHRDEIKDASLVANPGCYPTGALLGLAPLAGEDYLDHDSIIIDSKSGVSGAGRSPSQPFMFSEVNESVNAYAVASHRHTPEIEQELSTLFRQRVKVIFTPHITPADRGILSTIYVKINKSVNISQVHKRYRDFFSKEPFVRVVKRGVYPTTKAVKGSNFCDIALFIDTRNRNHQSLIIVSAIDNLLKGASGQAVQNMNIIYGFDETEGLITPPPFP